MKVALNPAELRLILDALDDKPNFSCKAGRGGCREALNCGALFSSLQRSLRRKASISVSKMSCHPDADGACRAFCLLQTW